MCDNYTMYHLVICVYVYDSYGIFEEVAAVFVRINKRVNKHGEMTYKATVMKSERVNGKVVQTTVAYLGAVEEDQIPYLKAAYAKKKPRLVWDDEEPPQDVERGR